MAFRDLALGVQAQQFFRQGRNRRGGPALHAPPIGAAHLGQLRRHAFGAHVLVQQADLVHRHIEAVRPGVLNEQVVAVQSVDLHVLHADIAPDAVHVVHHIVAALDIRKILELRPFVLRFEAVAPLQSVNVVFREQDPVLVPEAEPVEEFAGTAVHAARLFRCVVKTHGRHAVFPQVFRDAARLQDRRHHDVGRHAVRRQAAQVLDEQVDAAVVRGRPAHGHLEMAVGRELVPLQGRNSNDLRRFRLLFQLLRLPYIVPEIVGLLVQVVRRLQQKAWFVEDEERVLRAVFEQVGIVHAVVPHFAQRKHAHGLDGPDGAFRVQVIGTHVVHGFVEPFEAHRTVAVQGKDVHDFATHAKLTDGVHFIGPFVAYLRQFFNQSALVQVLAFYDLQGPFDEPFRLGQALHPGFGRHEDDACLLVVDEAQGRGPAGLYFEVPRLRLHARQVHGIQFLHGQVGIEPGQGLPVFAHGIPSGDDENQRARRLHQGTEGRQENGFRGAVQAGQRHPFVIAA